MELLLGLDCDQRLENEVSDTGAANFKAGYVVGDVRDQACEECDLERFIEGNELQSGDTGGVEFSWAWGVWQSAVGLLLLLNVSDYSI